MPHPSKVEQSRGKYEMPQGEFEIPHGKYDMPQGEFEIPHGRDDEYGMPQDKVIPRGKEIPHE